MIFLAVLLYSCEPGTNRQDAPETEVAEGEAKPLVYTKHARCRMECREISEHEILYVIEKGFINEQKSDASKKPCPTYAYEARTSDGQLVRVVVGDCATERKVITCIDLENDYSCSCY